MRLLRVVAVFGFILFSLTAVAGPRVSTEARECVDCHSRTTPGIVEQWRGSAHARNAVDCYSCHRANEKDPATFDHYGHRIAVIATPNYCGRCHAREVEQFERSHHAQTGQPGQAPAGGCQRCHGTEVKYGKDGKFDANTWPNGGIGRLNPDGSRGNCAECHGRHSFSLAVARGPEVCGRCHLGSSHPQIETYNESKHGIQFRANIARMNLDSKSWVVGKDYSAAPTCATCHMGATGNQPVTHDVDDRISHTFHSDATLKPDGLDQTKRVSAMKDVCLTCHANEWVENFYARDPSLIREVCITPAQTQKTTPGTGSQTK